MTTTESMFFDVQQKTDKQHILDNPDTYIGSVETVDAHMWVVASSPVSTASTTASATVEKEGGDEEEEKEGKEEGKKEEKEDKKEDTIVSKHISLVPGLLKLFDEAIVNCRDHVVRMQSKIHANVPNSLPVTYIDVTVEDDGTISMCNDGNGIDVVQHPDFDNTWVPELVFANLRTSTNFDKSEKKIVGGKNGLGFKLVLVWSVFGCVETVDHLRGLKYTQRFEHNLDLIHPPTIVPVKHKGGGTVKPYTRITFKPDYARLQVAEGGLHEDMVALFKRRVYDISAITDKSVRVRFNGTPIAVRQFEPYVSLFLGDKTAAPRVYECPNERWEYAVARSPTHEFLQVSFVNGIHTPKGGKHVEYIINQITSQLAAIIEKRRKIKVAPSVIRGQIALFLRCDIENPAFDSQTKDFLNTPASKFGSQCLVSEKFIDKVAKMNFIDTVCHIAEIKEQRSIGKSDGSKCKSVSGIPKLDDANWAGTAKSSLCTLILCEGDSAKTGVLSGLSAKDRDTFGVYPMMGKIMNVRGEPALKISESPVITEIKKILGLKAGESYDSLDKVHAKLRYGRVLFLTDQDLDGSHIKGLCINLFQHQWASLLHLPGFLGFINTPILKARRGPTELHFYNQGEYDQWKASVGHDTHGWTIKYYKGLGTSNKTEFQEYFQAPKIVQFVHSGLLSDDAIDMVFNKKRAHDRKHWLESTYDRNSFANTSLPCMSYEEFIHKELIHFAKYDCDRSIPNVMDGLKTSLRKILFAAFKKHFTSEVKVAQFAGYVSEHSSYHHGEQSLHAAITGMAQNFVGSNNINLLFPSGQFGSRVQGGEDASSARYTHTRLESITRFLFVSHDDPILHYLNDDGTFVEPQFYVPILPMVLVNGTKGIGTGFSTEILCYNPLDIIRYLKRKLCHTNDTRKIKEEEDKKEEDKKEEEEEKQPIDFVPYYEGWTGTVQRLSPTKFLFKGTYQVLNDTTLCVTELPVGFWTDNFKALLEQLADKPRNTEKPNNTDLPKNKRPASALAPALAPSKRRKPNDALVVATEDTTTVVATEDAILIKEFHSHSTDTTIHFVITFHGNHLTNLLASPGDHPGCNGLEKLLKLYSTCSTTNMNLFNANDVLTKYATVEDIIDDYYVTRIAHYQKRKTHCLQQLSQEAQLLTHKSTYLQELLDGSIDLRAQKTDDIHQLLLRKGYPCDDQGQFKYLTKMPMDAVTDENVRKMHLERTRLLHEIQQAQHTSEEDMWLLDLDAFETQYHLYRAERAAASVPPLPSSSLKNKNTRSRQKKT